MLTYHLGAQSGVPLYEQLYRARGLYDQYKRILWRYLFRFTLRN